jgi:gluconokinase
MGVAGSGKTTVGRQLAVALDWRFYDADDFHPPANLAKMAADNPLTDADRELWLRAVRARIEASLAANENAVIACSALKTAYRKTLHPDADSRVRLVHLHGSPELLAARISARTGHFMKPTMLASQLATLETPADAVVIDIAQTPAAIVAEIRARLDV